MVFKCMGRGADGSQVYGDGVGMRLIFNTVSLFDENPKFIIATNVVHFV